MDDSGHPDTAEGRLGQRTPATLASVDAARAHGRPRRPADGLCVRWPRSSGCWARVMHDGSGLSGAVFFGVWMFLIYLYEPELTRLVRRMNQ